MGGEDIGIDLAHGAQHLPAGCDDGRGARRVQAGLLAGAQLGTAERQGLLQLAPPRRGSHGVGTGAHGGEHLALVGQRLAARRAAEHVGQLEQPDAGVAVRLVVGQGLQQARPQRRAQQALLGGHRVGEGDGVLGQPGPGMVAGPEQRQGHGFGQPEAHHHLAEQPAVALALRERAGMGRGRHRLADALVAVLARHLLDDVDLLDAVGPPAGDGDLLHAGALGGGHVEADGLQEPGDVVVGQLDAEQLRWRGWCAGEERPARAGRRVRRRRPAPPAPTGSSRAAARRSGRSRRRSRTGRHRARSGPRPRSAGRGAPRSGRPRLARTTPSPGRPSWCRHGSPTRRRP